MKVNIVLWSVLLLCGGTLLPLPAQESAADQKRFEALRARADKGDAEAQLQLATLYATGNGVAKDLVKAAKLHRKAAEQGNALAQCRLGLDYAYGDGVKQSMTEAVHWLGKAADQGQADAQFDLGAYYASGDIPGKSVVDAAELYRKAAEQGMPQAEASLGTCYFEGAGVPKSIPEGLKWTRKAAEQGNPGAQQVLGLCYAKGKGVVTNYVEAYKWLALAAAKDNQSSDDIKVNLSMVERLMTPEQIAEGQKLAGEFAPSAAFTPHPPSSPASSGDSHGTNTGSASTSAARTGQVNVRAADDTYEVLVDGAFVGNTPAKLKLAEGSHLIEVKKAGFKDYRKQIQVGEGSELTVHANLEKQ